jgi:hypothetical protein
MRLYGAPSTSHVSSRMRLTGVGKATRVFAWSRSGRVQVRFATFYQPVRPDPGLRRFHWATDPTPETKSPTLRLPQAPARHSVNRLHAIVCTGHVRLPSGVLAQPLTSLEHCRLSTAACRRQLWPRKLVWLGLGPCSEAPFFSRRSRG